MQPSPLCNQSVRIMEVRRDAFNFVRVVKRWEAGVRLNYSMRVVAAATQGEPSVTGQGDVVRVPGVVHFVLAQHALPGGNGGHFPGGYLVRVDVDLSLGNPEIRQVSRTRCENTRNAFRSRGLG